MGDWTYSCMDSCWNRGGDRGGGDGVGGDNARGDGTGGDSAGKDREEGG